MLQSLRKILRGDLDAQACEILDQNQATIALSTQKRILGEDTEKLYKVGKFTDPQTQSERERERQTNDNKSFDLQTIKMKSDAFKENFSVSGFCSFQNFAFLHLRNYQLVVFSLIRKLKLEN